MRIPPSGTFIDSQIVNDTFKAHGLRPVGPNGGRCIFNNLRINSRSKQLTEPVRLELHSGVSQVVHFTAEPKTLAATETTFTITAGSTATSASEHELTIRATALQKGMLPVISETKIVVQLGKHSKGQ